MQIGTEAYGEKVVHNKHNRILWLYNHESLRAFEVPLLHRLGFEVFLPKIFPNTEEYGSGSVDTSYDTYLTIPPDKLKLLNQHDFYSKPIEKELIGIINSYFSSVIFGFFPNLLEQIITTFSGLLFFHVCGREAPNSYHSYLTSHLSKKLKRARDRFFFAQAYPFLSEIEKGIYKDKAITLPIGIPDFLLPLSNTWRGGNGKLLFVCPRITTSSYYKNIYIGFKKHFSDIPHLIAGKQFYQIDDPAIQGKLPREEYDHLLKSSEVMFYHSEEPRHVHYHPLEAIIFGLPLIYMRNGMLSRLTHHKDLPGACETYQEAKKKVLRVLQGDKLFIQEILETQKQLLEPFCNEYCETVWKNTFCKIIKEHALKPGIDKKSTSLFSKLYSKLIENWQY